MHLNTQAMRHLTADDWRVLAAVENGSKNHEIVPTPIIERLSRLRGGAGTVQKCISHLAKVDLIGRIKNAKYDGYRLTYGGADYLALHAYSTPAKHSGASAAQPVIYSVGSRVGVGKESDIIMVADPHGVQKVLKIHRLGRISFRTVRTNRDYLRNNKNRQSNSNSTASWLHLSKLAATKEYAFMCALREEGFPVPEPIAQSRHTIVMSFIDSYPLRQISSVPDPAGLYAEIIQLALRLARHGLIHGDFNEFNILIQEEEEPLPEDDDQEDAAEESQQQEADPNIPPQKSRVTVTPILIDFPQMVSMDHENAEMYFDRDIECIKRFFERRFHFVSTEPGPFFKDAKKTVGKGGARRLDAAVEASGFTKKMAKDLEAAIRAQDGAIDALRDEDTSDSDAPEDDFDGTTSEGDDGADDCSAVEDKLPKHQHDSEIPHHETCEISVTKMQISDGT